MTRVLLSGAVALASLAFGLQSGKAYEAPWCAIVNTGLDVYWDCQYQSVEQCSSTVLAGNHRFCNPNRYFVAQPTQKRRARRT